VLRLEEVYGTGFSLFVRENYCTRSFLSRNFLHRFAAMQWATKFRRPKKSFTLGEGGLLNAWVLVMDRKADEVKSNFGLRNSDCGLNRNTSVCKGAFFFL
jgi:hypothetical protein